MKKIIIFFLLIFTFNFSHADTNIVYLDVQFIIDNSDLGKFYKEKIKIQQTKNKSLLSPKENEINELETEFKNQKNLLSQEEINNKLNKLNDLIRKYQIFKNELNNKIIDEKKKYSSEILKHLNPLLTNYVEKNNITLVLEKKNILVGIKTLDVTNRILNILNDDTKNKKLINEN